jgi:glyoxylase-like metal-dependent hydrolase (beta-lactamase superfamily II)
MQAKLLKLTDGIYVRNEVDNIGMLDMGDYAAIIDTHEDLKLKDEILSQIKQSLPAKPVKLVLNTHLHYDHVVLNSYFLSHGAAAVSLKTHPNGHTIKGKHFSVEMFSVAGCHSDYDAAFFIPEKRVLFTGDIFGWGLVSWEPALTDAKKSLIEKAYQKFISLDPEIIVPGHGPVCQVTHLRRWLSYFHDMLEITQKLKARGIPKTEAINQVPPPKDMHDWWRFTEWKHAFTMERIINYVYKG